MREDFWAVAIWAGIPIAVCAWMLLAFFCNEVEKEECRHQWQVGRVYSLSKKHFMKECGKCGRKEYLS